ncbi:MAG TPA: hypothetical protein PLK76_00905 [bacterium]|nr:hypothetical protein [bacterium]
MSIPVHLATNTIIGAIFYRFGIIDLLKFYLLFIALGFLLDVDHVLYFIIKERTLNPKKLFTAGRAERRKMKAHLYIFHSPEFNLLLLILSFFNQIFFIILLSNLIHLSLDIIEHYRFHKNFKWLKEWSLINNLIR